MMCAHGSASSSSVTGAESLLVGLSEVDCPSPGPAVWSLMRDAREAAGRGFPPALARAAAALTRDATALAGPGGGVGDRPWLRERLWGSQSVYESTTGGRCGGERVDILGLKPPGVPFLSE